MTTLFALALVVLLGAGPVLAQFSAPDLAFQTPRSALLLDYAYFRTDSPDSARLEIYYQIFNHGLEFRQEGDRLRAAYELQVDVRKDDNLIESVRRSREIYLGVEDRVRARADHRTSQVNFDLPYEKYDVQVTLRDLSNGKVLRKDFDVKLENLQKNHPKLSSIEFVKAFQPAEKGEPSVFDKRDLSVVPSVGRMYGSELEDRLAFYFEVYPGEDTTGKLILDTRVRHFRKGLMYRDTLHLWIGNRTERQLREISLGDMAPGEYELEITLRGRRMKELAKRTEEFQVVWTEEGMIRHDWESTVQQLDLFSEEDDLGDMKKLEGYEERLRAFNDFWREHDPTVGTLENEAKEAFYYRVRVANENFGIMRRPGWKTDRGRIYIEFGPPDHIVDVPFAPETVPYQVWHYTSIGRYRRFLFIDENADGDYRLQYPYDGLNQRPDF